MSSPISSPSFAPCSRRSQSNPCPSTLSIHLAYILSQTARNCVLEEVNLSQGQRSLLTIPCRRESYKIQVLPLHLHELIQGVRNLRFLSRIAVVQKLSFEFPYHEFEIDTDIPLLVLGASKTILPVHS